MWDPGQYRRFGDERSRPFYELVGRIGATEPRFVADLGCGPGELTADLCRRWPAADVLGVDSSPEMIGAAGELLAGRTELTEELPAGEEAVWAPGGGPAGAAASPVRLRFELADARDWSPAGPVDVIVSNALLQWIPDHEKLMVRWARALADGGWLAVQMPGNFGQPTHALLRELAASARWRPLLRDVEFNRQAGEPAAYLDLLTREGCAVDAWETTYLHVLAGDDPVLRWIEGTGLRPVITALDEPDRGEFLAEYGSLLRDAYPRAEYGTVFPFRRVFVVARRPGG